MTPVLLDEFQQFSCIYVQFYILILRIHNYLFQDIVLGLVVPNRWSRLGAPIGLVFSRDIYQREGVSKHILSARLLLTLYSGLLFIVQPCLYFSSAVLAVRAAGETLGLSVVPRGAL